MSVLIVIPARYASTRYPGKPLVALKGASGEAKTLIQRSWEAAMAVAGVDRVVVATDDDRIKTTAEGFGAEVVMTSDKCRNGTERCAEVLERIADCFDIVVNLQGDAPLTPAWFVEDLINSLKVNPAADVATPVLRADGATLNGFLEDRRAGRVGGTTAVFGAGNSGWDVGPLEMLEGLEQLRFLENGRKLMCVEVESRGRQFWELNNPEDVPKLESMMKAMRSG